MSLEGKKIVLGITGGIAAFKAHPLPVSFGSQELKSNVS